MNVLAVEIGNQNVTYATTSMKRQIGMPESMQPILTGSFPSVAIPATGSTSPQVVRNGDSYLVGNDAITQLRAENYSDVAIFPQHLEQLLTNCAEPLLLFAIASSEHRIIDLLVIGLPSEVLVASCWRSWANYLKSAMYGKHTLVAGNTVEVRKVLLHSAVHGAAVWHYGNSHRCDEQGGEKYLIVNFDSPATSWEVIKGKNIIHGYSGSFHSWSPDDLARSLGQQPTPECLMDCPPLLRMRSLVGSGVDIDRIIACGPHTQKLLPWLRAYYFRHPEERLQAADQPVFASTLGLLRLSLDWAQQNRDQILEVSDQEAYVYAMRTPTHRENVYKIGGTQDAAVRAKNLSRETSCATPMGVIEKWRVTHWKSAETAAHEALKSLGAHEGKEFFVLEYSKLREVVMRAIEPWRLYDKDE